MKLSQAFKDMDKYIKENLDTITCHDIFEIKSDFYTEIESLCGNTANFTGLTELLIFRFMYHALGMTEDVQNKLVQQDNMKLLIGNRYIGKNGKYQEPDIVVEKNEVIKYLLSIKNILSTVSPTKNEKESILIKELIKQNGVCTNSIQDIFRIDNIRHNRNNNFNSITIVFSKIPQRHKRAIEIIHNKFEWHRFLILENNNNSFLTELKKKLNFSNSSIS
ncbi:hypothetical protein [Priestia koreensis]|uniref:hypothetical protein n=1 Tax=Priestia koreensis TaxID=284581 RepID=UPI00345A1689